MSDPFLSSDEYDERAHQLYNEGQYDDAIDALREGLGLYPHAVELHVGMGYARLAREEYAWARRSFEEARGLDPNHEDTLAGLGEVLLKFGERGAALACFERVLALGFQDDHDLMLQIGRALFREAVLDQARRFFEGALNAHPDSADAAACVGYAAHRLADEGGSLHRVDPTQAGSVPDQGDDSQAGVVAVEHETEQRDTAAGDDQNADEQYGHGEIPQDSPDGGMATS